MQSSTQQEKNSLLLKPGRKVGIAGYGAYIPRYRLPASEVTRIWRGGKGGEPVKEKAVAGTDEDVVSMAIEAGRNALARAAIAPSALRAVWIGSESHPYAVKPSSTIVAEALGATPNIQAADIEFACKAGSEAMVMAMGLVGSKMAEYAMAIGVDTAQGRPGDDLEYTAACGGAAFIIAAAEESLAAILASYSYVTDTPDFWRREGEKYPRHGQRFTGDPAYFKHITSAGRGLMEAMGTTAADYQYAVFHQPNTRFPQMAGKQLGFTPEQLKTGLLSPVIGNTYAGAGLLGLTAILDVARAGDRILLVTYGSGAGSDAFDLQVKAAIEECRGRAPLTTAYIERRTPIDYGMYVRMRNKLAD